MFFSSISNSIIFLNLQSQMPQNAHADLICLDLKHAITLQNALCVNQLILEDSIATILG